jgi:7-carboxy-7-deazaguanine synthase
LRIVSGHELKLVYPQAGLDPVKLRALDFKHFWLQPMDGPDRAANTDAAIAYCLSHPDWRLSVQMHKLVGIQ